MTSAEFRRWVRLHESRAKHGVLRSPWFAALVAGALLAVFVYWRGDNAGPIAAVKGWLAGAIAAFALAFMRVPFHLYWRPDAALLAQLPIGGGPLFDAALLRCIRAAAATALAVLLGAAPIALLDPQTVDWATRELLATPIAGPNTPGLTPIELAARCAALAGTFFVVAAFLLPAVATWAASLVTHSRDALEIATALGGAPVRDKKDGPPKPPGSGSAGTLLGALPGFASTVVIVFVIIAAPWLYNRETSLPGPMVLLGLVAVSLGSIVASRASAPRVMGTILRDVSALDRQQLATLEIRPPTAIEGAVARMLGDGGLPYRKDARLMRRRYPMAFALGALCFLVLAILGLARPADPTPWLVAVLAGAIMYAAALASRLARPPIELPRLSATLPIAAGAGLRAKIAWVSTWSLVFVVVPLVFAIARLA